MQRSKSVFTPPLAFVAAGGAWVLYGLLLPLYQPLHYVICGAVSVFVFMVARALLKPRLKQLEFTSGISGARQSELLIRCDAMIGQLGALDARIADQGVSDKIVRIKERFAGMAEQAAKDAGKEKHITLFLDYYLPTTVRLLETYASLEKTSFSTGDIVRTRTEIESALDTVASAFDDQLEHMMRDDLMDISADIAALEGMLKRSGLSGK